MEKRQNEANCSWCWPLVYSNLGRTKAGSSRKTNPILGLRSRVRGERRAASGEWRVAAEQWPVVSGTGTVATECEEREITLTPHAQ